MMPHDEHLKYTARSLRDNGVIGGKAGQSVQAGGSRRFGRRRSGWRLAFHIPRLERNAQSEAIKKAWESPQYFQHETRRKERGSSIKKSVGLQRMRPSLGTSLQRTDVAATMERLGSNADVWLRLR